MDVKSNNKGFSLIELIVVIMIMAIMTGGAVMSYNVVHDADVSAAADELTSMLTGTRKLAIAKEADTIQLAIEYDDDKFYGRIYEYDGTNWVKISEEKLGGSSLRFTIENSGMPIQMPTPRNKVEFNFKKSNGSLKEDYTKIIITGSKTREITVIKETGRCIAD